MKVDVWVSIGVNIDVNDPSDYTEVAEKALKPILQKIKEDGLYEAIEEITPYDPDKQ